MAGEKPQKGIDWGTDVGDRAPDKKDARNEFYKKLAALRADADPNVLLNEPAKHGFKTFEELAKVDFETNINAAGAPWEKDKGWTLHEIFEQYLKKVGASGDKLKQEIGLTLYYLTNFQNVNVDYLNAKWKLQIKS